MVRRNSNFATFKASYLFVDIAARKKQFLAKNPDAKLISLGIGDTTEPLPKPIVENIIAKAKGLGIRETYSGYPEYNGSEELRELIVRTFYQGLNLTKDEIFISDGSKPDLARLQLFLGRDLTVAVQDPVYPAYVDGSVISGKAGQCDEETGKYSKLVYMSCTPENQFFPDLDTIEPTDVIFFCSPNNPTGAASTRQQLEKLVEFARKNKSLIIYDSAYSGFIVDENIPRSIFAIPGASEVAIETSSFSKLIGFTGVRLGWTVCPKILRYDDGTPMWDDWSRIMGTCFNGSCSLAEAGGLGCLGSQEGLASMREMISYYLHNAQIIRNAMEDLKFECHGGENSPYVWVRMPGEESWDVFQMILERAHVVTTPGVGFGREGSGFIRLSAFAHQEDVVEAVRRIKVAFKE